MFRKFLHHLVDLFDKKLKNGTIMVAIISMCIAVTGAVTHASANMTANLLQAQKHSVESQYILVAGKKYKIVLEEVE